MEPLLVVFANIIPTLSLHQLDRLVIRAIVAFMVGTCRVRAHTDALRVVPGTAGMETLGVAAGTTDDEAIALVVGLGAELG
jgi:hypothetical protein